jgi:putative endonuclease
MLARRAAPGNGRRRAAPPGSTVAIGQRAEDRAAAALARAGYRVVERNVRFSLGELDAVAYQGDTLVFIEVRSRRDDRFGGGLAAVTAAKQRRVARAAATYLALRRPSFRACRFDVVGITGDELVIVKDAFRITW